MQTAADLVVLTIVAMLTTLVGFLVWNLAKGMRERRRQKTLVTKYEERVSDEVVNPGLLEELSPACRVAVAESQLDPELFAGKYEYADAILRLALESAGFCVWDIGDGEDKKLGWHFGVNLDWPDLGTEALRAQCLKIREFSEVVGRMHALEPMTSQPDMVAGGAMCVFVGFINAEFIAKTGKSKQPVYDPQIPGWESRVPPEETRTVPWPESMKDLRDEDAFKDKLPRPMKVEEFPAAKDITGHPDGCVCGDCTAARM